MSRIGIDLSATRCHLIEVGRSRGRWARGSPNGRLETVVRAFQTIPHGWADPERLTPALRGWAVGGRRWRRARATVWGMASTQRSMWLPAGESSDLARLAVIRAAPHGSEADVVARTAEGGPRVAANGSPGRDVAVAITSRNDFLARLRLLTDAGFDVDELATPAMALCSVARLRRSLVPGESVALLAIGADVSALAVVRDGLPLLAREMPWGYERAGARVFDTDRLVGKISSEIRRSLLYVKQTMRSDVAQVLMCGESPALRTLTAPLIEELDLEIETLDSLDGIASDALPEPAEAFRAQVGGFRLAWALAAADGPPMTFVRASAGRRRWAAREAVGLAAGVAVSVALGVSALRTVDRAARLNDDRVAELERQVAELEPEARRIGLARMDRALTPARRAALAGIALQGPRLTRVLEAVSQSTPPEVTLNALTFAATGTAWTATLSGVAVAADPARAREAVDELLRGIAISPYVVAPLETPTLRLVTDDVGFSVRFRVPR